MPRLRCSNWVALDSSSRIVPSTMLIECSKKNCCIGSLASLEGRLSKPYTLCPCPSLGRVMAPSGCTKGCIVPSSIDHFTVPIFVDMPTGTLLLDTIPVCADPLSGIEKRVIIAHEYVRAGSRHMIGSKSSFVNKKRQPTEEFYETARQKLIEDPDFGSSVLIVLLQSLNIPSPRMWYTAIPHSRM